MVEIKISFRNPIIPFGSGRDRPVGPKAVVETRTALDTNLDTHVLGVVEQ